MVIWVLKKSLGEEGVIRVLRSEGEIIEMQRAWGQVEKNRPWAGVNIGNREWEVRGKAGQEKRARERVGKKLFPKPRNFHLIPESTESWECLKQGIAWLGH